MIEIVRVHLAGAIQAAIVGPIGFALVELKDKGPHIMRAYLYDGRPFTLASFDGLDGPEPGDAVDFEARIADELLYRQELEALGRRRIVDHRSTPWGSIQHAELYGPGIVSVSTASHGGFLVDADVLERMPVDCRLPGGVFEEDCDWALVATSFPELFTTRERAYAADTIKHWHPAVHERLTGEKPAPDNPGMQHEAMMAAERKAPPH